MDYEEFRWVLGDTATIPLLRSVWEHPQPLKEAHRKLMRDFRLYMLVGRMPQAVNAYLDTNISKQLIKPPFSALITATRCNP